VGDGIAYVADAPDAVFDIIIVDSTDPAGPGEALFTDAFYRDCARVLSAGGMVVNQCGVPFMQADELQETSRLRAVSFPHVSAYVVAVPTYVGGFMTLGIATKQALARLSVAEITARAERAGVLGTTSYWSPALHNAAFELPPYIARFLPK
jgi:spermidine synthase